MRCTISNRTPVETEALMAEQMLIRPFTAGMCVYIYIYICIYTYRDRCICVCVCMFMYVCVYMYIYIYIYIYVCVCIYIYIYISVTNNVFKIPTTEAWSVCVVLLEGSH